MEVYCSTVLCCVAVLYCGIQCSTACRSVAIPKAGAGCCVSVAYAYSWIEEK